jgi:hypothetical protein
MQIFVKQGQTELLNPNQPLAYPDFFFRDGGLRQEFFGLGGGVQQI